MELNTRGRYAVMALSDIANRQHNNTVALPAIADDQGISLAYLEQLFSDLKSAGIVESVRGRLGGYRLCRPPETISIAEVMHAVGEPLEMTRCGAHGLSGCVAGQRCLTHDLWQALGDHILGFLDAVSLADVINGLPAHLRTVPYSQVSPAMKERGNPSEPVAGMTVDDEFGVARS